MKDFHTVTLNVPASVASPSSSSTSCFTSADAEMTGPTLPHPPLPQPTQCENNKDEDLYDDPRPLSE